jgi:cobalt-zinc-cadmium efflux system membrane fusion protein
MYLTNRIQKFGEDLQSWLDSRLGDEQPAGTMGLPLRRQIWLLGFIGGISLSVIAVGTAVALFLDRPTPEPPAPTPGTFQPTAQQFARLTFATVASKPFRTEITAEGSIAIDDDLATPIFPPFSGRVTKVYAKVGDVVAKGAPLLAVDATDVVQAQNDFVASAGAHAAAQAQLSVALAAEQRAHGLYDIKAAALKDVQQAQADLAAARTAERSSAAALAAARDRLRIFGKDDAEIDKLSAEGHRFTAETLVRAPIAGTVLQRQIGPGQYIQSGSATPVATVGDLSKVWLVANVREDDATQVHPGQEAQVTVPGLPGRTFTARIAMAGPMLDPVTHRLPVRAEIDNPDGILKPQMFVAFKIMASDATEAPAIPESAVLTEGDSARVWIETAHQSLALRQVRLGRERDHEVEVVDGLKPGDRVVSSGAVFIDRAGTAD